MAIRQIVSVDVSESTTPKCLNALTRKLKRLGVAEADVISIQCEMDDAGVTVWAFYWH